MIAKFPDGADWATCADITLQELCDAITKADLPTDIRDLLRTSAAVLAVGIALSHKDQGRIRIKKCRAQSRKKEQAP